jgi:hypothetical protein
VKPPYLQLIRSPYRRLAEPLLKYIEQLREKHPGRLVAVILPEFVKRSWWQYLLHNHRAAHLRVALMQYAGPGLVIVNVPWHLRESNEGQLERPRTQPSPGPANPQAISG